MKFQTKPSLVVRMSPTFLMQDSWIEQSVLLKCLLGVIWEAFGLFKTVYNIDVKTQHIHTSLWKAGELAACVSVG